MEKPPSYEELAKTITALVEFQIAYYLGRDGETPYLRAVAYDKSYIPPIWRRAIRASEQDAHAEPGKSGK